MTHTAGPSIPGSLGGLIAVTPILGYICMNDEMVRKGKKLLSIDGTLE